jgi:acyl-CoA synthetase (AMP-forming)/AMP-acid ligase II
LVNPEMSAGQILALDERFRFDLYVHDGSLPPALTDTPLGQRALPAYQATGPSIDRMSVQRKQPKVWLKRVRAGAIVVMTGGTTGQPKAASRQPSFFDFLPPFVALLTQAHLDRYRSVFIATPMYHGFGLASLLMGVVLGAEMHFTQRFDAARASALIARHQIEVVTLVPLMLQRLLRLDAGSLTSLRCILSGGAMLNPALAQETLARLGPILFNLYGTSEAGFAILATPDTLARKPASIGKPIRGAQTQIVNESNQVVAQKGIGRLCVRSAWSTSRPSWIETGDLAYRDEDGDIYLCGRVDDMIVSGGENVYPLELETVLMQHPAVDAAAVVGIPDAEFGQRLKAVLVVRPGATLDQPTLLDWLKPRVARYQMPAVVEFRDELPSTSLGKLDKKRLKG